MAWSSPMGWSSGRQHYHYRAVLPSADRGMQAILHRNVPRNMHSRRTVDNPMINIISGMRILDRQRLPTNLPRCYRPFLSQLDTDAPDGKGDPSTGRDVPTFRSLPALPDRKFTSADVKKITTRLSTYDVTRVPEGRGFPDKEPEPPQSSRRAYTETEIDSVVNRLSSYDAKVHPAESKGTAPDAQPMSSRSYGGQQRSGGEVKKIVMRLHTYDPSKWPPESKIRKTDY